MRFSGLQSSCEVKETSCEKERTCSKHICVLRDKSQRKGDKVGTSITCPIQKEDTPCQASLPLPLPNCKVQGDDGIAERIGAKSKYTGRH